MDPMPKSRASPTLLKGTSMLEILLAEDNTINQRLTVKMFEKYQHAVTVVRNGLEAVEAIKERRFDVILMDIQMPVVGGFEATAMIREYERSVGAQNTPIIALTANAMIGDREICLQAHMDGYLSKPLNNIRLLENILECILFRSSSSGRS